MMELLTTTPFGQRPVTAGLLARQALARAPVEIESFNKWEMFRNLCAARLAYGLTDRDLTVLNALLSFYKGDSLKDGENLIVFPSNRRLAERAHGMAESTLRRHLGALCRAGVLLRHDSPNGKRYAAKDADGQIVVAFGFNLRPMLVQARQISEAADKARADQEALKRAREAASLLFRDAGKLLAFAVTERAEMDWSGSLQALAEAQRAYRRKLLRDEVTEISRTVRKIIDQTCEVLEGPEANRATVMNGKDDQNERHHQTSKTDSKEFEPHIEKGYRQVDGGLSQSYETI